MGGLRCSVVLVVAGLFGGVVLGCGDDSDHASRAVETVLDLRGTWSNEDTWSDEDTWFEGPDRPIPMYGPTTLTFTDCAVGEQCGHLERINDNRKHCAHELVYRSEDVDGFNFETSRGVGSISCNYDPWSDGVLHLTPGPDGTVEVVAGGVESTVTTLRRVED